MFSVLAVLVSVRSSCQKVLFERRLSALGQFGVLSARIVPFDSLAETLGQTLYNPGVSRKILIFCLTPVN